MRRQHRTASGANKAHSFSACVCSCHTCRSISLILLCAQLLVGRAHLNSLVSMSASGGMRGRITSAMNRCVASDASVIALVVMNRPNAARTMPS